MEDQVVVLGATLATGGVIAGIIGYIKYMKKKVRKSILRPERIEKYFR